ncbi:MAG: hypothetical protein II863_12885, partial [Kiritimatiellae bacterium]|nr:hypothetical protein [Kiritimatiellia bacterium]
LKGGKFTVSAKSLVAAQKSQADATFGSFKPPELVVKKTAPQKLDKNGRPPEAVWSAGILVDGPAGDKFRLAHDGTYLYYAYTCKRNGQPMKNGGKDPTTYLETGGAFDLMLQTSSKAKPDRREGAKGDIRLLFAQVGGKVVCVKYDYVGAKSAKNAHTFESPVGKLKVSSVSIEPSVTTWTYEGRGHCTLRAVIPLALLGNVDLLGETRGDFGRIVGDSTGTVSVERSYWSNKATSLMSDEPTQAGVEPRLWGKVRFE